MFGSTAMSLKEDRPWHVSGELRRTALTPALVQDIFDKTRPDPCLCLFRVI